MNATEQEFFICALGHTNAQDLGTKEEIENLIKKLHDEENYNAEIDCELYKKNPNLYSLIMDLLGFWDDAKQFGRKNK